MQNTGGLFKTIRDSFLILFFESLGTFFLALLYQTSSSRDICGFMMCFYMLLVLGAKISGSHYNPAVTLAFMFRKDVGKFSRILGFAYILFQFIGAFLGNLVALLYTYDNI
jgi:glycerol uptake facilitator-like aquaporin